MAHYAIRRDLYEAKGSDVTSEVYWVGDARSISMWLDASVITVQGTNQEGRDSAIDEDNWSLLTTLTDPDKEMLDIEPGFRWLRTLRSGSTGTAVLSLQQIP